MSRAWRDDDDDDDDPPPCCPLTPADGGRLRCVSEVEDENQTGSESLRADRPAPILCALMRSLTFWSHFISCHDWDTDGIKPDWFLVNKFTVRGQSDGPVKPAGLILMKEALTAKPAPSCSIFSTTAEVPPPPTRERKEAESRTLSWWRREISSPTCVH